MEDWNMTSKRLLALVLTLILSFSAIPAFAASEVEGELNIWVRASTGGAESVFGIWGNNPGDAYYDYLKEQFPNLKLNYSVNRGWEEIAPDLFFWEGDAAEMVQRLLAQGLCEPLNSYIENDDTFVNNFVPALLEAHTVDGQLYGLPFDVMPYGIFVNYDVLDKANVDYPALDWTIDDFTEMCQKVTNKSDPYNTTIAIARNVDENDYVRFLNMFFAAYGVKTYGEKDGAKYSNLSEDPAAITAVEKYLELQANNYAYTLSAEERSAMGLDNSVWNIDWAAGIAATFPGVSSWAFEVDENGDPKFNQVFYPAFSGPEGSGATLNVISYSMYAGSKNKEAAWEYLKAVTSEEFRENAYAKNPADEGETVHVFRYDEDTTSFTFGLPPFTTEYTLNEDFAKLYNGLYAAMQNPYTAYVNQPKLLEATQKVARGEMQLVDALKEYDEYVNANNLIVYPN